MLVVVIGSLWFLIGGGLSIALAIRFFLALKRKQIHLVFNWKRLAIFVALMVLAQIVPAILMALPATMAYSYLWPFAYSANLLVFMLLLRVFKVQFSSAEMLFPLFPLVPGIVFWIVQKEANQ